MYFLAALTSTQVYEHATGAQQGLGMDPKELEGLLWFFRTEDRKCHCLLGWELRDAHSLAVHPPA